MSEPAVVETHISLLFFVEDRVFKIKKPVRYSFIDLSALPARRRACDREVELNRRLAPDVYIGVTDVLDDHGRTVDHAVVMRRLPEDRRLATLVRSGTNVDACLREVARCVAAFHASAPTSARIAAAGDEHAVRAKWDENLEEMRRFIGRPLDAATFAEIETAAGRYIDGRSPLFSERAAAERIRDGHGDLQAEDIFCLHDGPRILDCIEFDDRLRYGDVLADVAFLAMDLERLGARDEASFFLHWYRDFSGETYPQSLADFYIAFRALIRSKVACLKQEQQGDAPKGAEAKALLAWARQHLDAARVRLVLVGGLPGTGKSTLARGLAEATGWSVLRSDEVRKELAGVEHLHRAPAAFGAGPYADEMTRRTYDELIRRATRLLAQGESVVLDASWVDEGQRRAARTAADATSSDVHELRCVLDAAVAAERMRSRTARGDDVSDADETVAAAMAIRADRWPSAVTIDTSRDPAACIARATSVTSGRAERSRSGSAHDARIAG